MINAENIGKRIRFLRKQKHVSQERMAEDLGMYQADISNLERAIGGSGITDVFKLDQIAEYFGITLGELLNGFKKPLEDASIEEKSPEEPEMSDYIISDIQNGENVYSLFSELSLVAPDDQVIFVSFLELDNEPSFYRSGKSKYKLLATAAEDEKSVKELNRTCFLSGEDYDDIFNRVDIKWLKLCRYLLFVATEDEKSVKELIERTKGKKLGEVEVPVPSKEPEEMFLVDYSDLSVVYRYRLLVETILKYPSIFDDLENYTKKERAILEKLKAACESEKAYKVWKKDLVDSKVKEVKEKEHIVVYEYMFAGIGQYKEIMTAEMIPSFKCWLWNNGSAFDLGYHDANEKEIRAYVSQHIADDLLGIDSRVEQNDESDTIDSINMLL